MSPLHWRPPSVTQFTCNLSQFPILFPVSFFLYHLLASIFHVVCSVDWLFGQSSPSRMQGLWGQEFLLFNSVIVPVTQNNVNKSLLNKYPPFLTYSRRSPFRLLWPILLRAKRVIIKRNGLSYQDLVGRMMGINPLWSLLVNWLSPGRSTFCHQDLNCISETTTYVLLCPLKKGGKDCYMFSMEYYFLVRNVYEKEVNHRHRVTKCKNINKQYLRTLILGQGNSVWILSDIWTSMFFLTSFRPANVDYNNTCPIERAEQ